MVFYSFTKKLKTKNEIFRGNFFFVILYPKTAQHHVAFFKTNAQRLKIF